MLSVYSLIRVMCVCNRMESFFLYLLRKKKINCIVFLL